ncbi:hypothetical protein, partial [Mycobacterium sp. GA-1841]|uniref:hypothetical protein n=1 Tax=Mycobacterium sp. GA-1841 TaxID=1834154 RepID=UPI0020C9B080
MPSTLALDPATPFIDRCSRCSIRWRSFCGKASSRLAIALDVWLAYELRRAGFDPDAVCPRAT